MPRKSKLNAVLITLAFVAFGIMPVSGQTTLDPVDWVRIVSPSGELSIDLPEKDMLVDNADSTYRLYSPRGDLSMYVSIYKNSNAKEDFRHQASHHSDGKKYEVFEAEDFLISSSVEGSAEKPYVVLTLASSGWSYLISLKGRETTKAELANALNSIQLKGKPMFKGSASPLPAKTAKIDSLQTSAIISQALAQPDSQQVDFPKGSPSDEPAKQDDIKYSRPLLMIRRPHAPYTDVARSKDIKGSVKLLISFLATGRLGEIRVLSSVDKGLEKNALKVAKKIKFIPAEIDGKPVDVVRTIEYTFTIY